MNTTKVPDQGQSKTGRFPQWAAPIVLALAFVVLIRRGNLNVGELTAGLPEGTTIAHKNGWVTTNGIINTIGDAGIIYTPGGNYVLVVFLYHPEQLIWDPAAALVAQLSTAVYNYYNTAP